MAMDAICHLFDVDARWVRREFDNDKSMCFDKREMFRAEPDVQEEMEGHKIRDNAQKCPLFKNLIEKYPLFFLITQKCPL